MTRVIQHKQSRQFLMPSGEWTASKKQARRFETITEAVNHCLNHSIHDVHLYCFLEGDDTHNFTLDILPPRPNTTPG